MLTTIIEFLFSWLIGPIADSLLSAIYDAVTVMPDLTGHVETFDAYWSGPYLNQFLPLTETFTLFSSALAAYFAAVTIRLLRRLLSLFTGGGGA